MYLDSDHVYRSELLDEFDWLIHGFGTRRSTQFPGEYTQVKQIHSDIVVTAGAERGSIGHGDALVSDSPGSLLGVRTADCIPVLLADPEHRAVGVVHAGWRGTVERITAKAVRKMVEAYGSDPKAIHAAIGPGINVCCFEVGPEVSEHFAGRPRHVDLIEANAEQLRTAGIEKIDVGRVCTRCESELLHSYRRDREASGRMVSAIGIRGLGDGERGRKTERA